MATPKKQAAAAKVGQLAPLATKKALDALRDPRVQELILQNASVIMDTARQWGTRIADNVGERFGQKGLERRADKLRGSVVALSQNSPELASALRPVNESLDEVSKLLHVAAALPFAKRKRAHGQIDDILDDLESGLFDTALSGARQDRAT